jgi:hypothetical protein
MGIEQVLNVGDLAKFPPAYSGNPSNGVISIGTTTKLQVVDKRVTITVKGGISLPGLNPVFAKTTEESMSRNIAVGENIEESYRNYYWLPWILGAVNYADQQGKDVMSGPFSGCYMIRYKHVGGSWRVAHVDMPGGSKAWNELASEDGFTIDCGFKPFLADRLGAASDDTTYGVITSDGKCWRMCASTTNLKSQRLIKEVKAIDSLAPESLFNLMSI